MPSGISERLIQRALGPIDFSYAYQKVENTAKQLAAEDRARKQSALKDYYTDLASMNKDKVGVRSVDVPEVSGLYNEWSTIEKQLASNPNLISRNPELYGQLKNKSEETYSKLMTTIRGSKELGKQEQNDFKQMANPEKMDFYLDGAPAEYRKNVIEKPWSEVVKSGAHDLTRYYETKIDGSEFYGDLGQRIESQATQKLKVPDLSFKGAPGEMRYIYFDKMPMIEKVQGVVADNLNAKLGKKDNKFAVQQLEDAMATGDYQKVKAKYEDFYNDNNPNGWKKYFDKKPTYIPLFQDGKPQKELFINYVTAKRFTSKLPEGILGEGEFGSESSKARYRESIRKVPEGGKGNKKSPYVDLYSGIVTYLQQPKALRGASVDRFDAKTQGIILDRVRMITGAKDLSNRDVYVTEDKNTGEILIKPMIDMYQTLSDEKGNEIKRAVYKKGQTIGKLTKDDINMEASKGFGVEGRKAAFTAEDIPPITAIKPAQESKGKKVIKGF